MVPTDVQCPCFSQPFSTLVLFELLRSECPPASTLPPPSQPRSRSGMPDVSTSAAFCRLLQPTHHHARHPAMPQAGFMNLFNFEPEKMHIRCMAHHAGTGSFTCSQPMNKCTSSARCKWGFSAGSNSCSSVLRSPPLSLDQHSFAAFHLQPPHKSS